jgi:hypothetical protein
MSSIPAEPPPRQPPAKFSRRLLSRTCSGPITFMAVKMKDSIGTGVFAEPGYSAVYTVPRNQETYFIKKVNE